MENKEYNALAKRMNKEEIIKGIVDRVDSKFPITPMQMDFFAEMVALINNDKDTEKVTCIPAPCGIGKSLLIGSCVKVCAKHNIGLLVLTDSVKRLNEYVENFIDNIFVCTAEMSVFQVLDEIKRNAVVLMTTQKYFGLDDVQREMLFDFKNKRMWEHRRKVIIDEIPKFYASERIGIKELNTIDTLLHCNLCELVEDKEEIIRLFENGKNRIKQYMKEHEQKNDEDYLFYANPNEFEQIRDSFGNFFDKIEKHRAELMKEESDHNDVKLIDLLRYLCENGGVFSTYKKSGGYKYETAYWVYQNKSNYFKTNMGQTKFFIFDATCDIHPLYQQDFIKVMDCSKYKRKLNLTINIVNISTSRNALKKDNDFSNIIKYVKSQKQSEPLIVTYADVEDAFKNAFAHTAHFGNLKGFNEYNNLTEMYQIGLNRCNPLEYYFMLCTNNQEVYDTTKAMTKEQSRDFFWHIIKLKNDSGKASAAFAKYWMDEILVNSIVADFEQNLFRLSVRNIGEERQNKVTLFTNYTKELYSRVCEEIEKRFKGTAEVKYLDTPDNIKVEKLNNRKSKSGETHLQKILKFLDSKEIGEVFEIKELCEKTKLTQKQLQKVKDNNPSIKNIFNEMKTDKRGWYAKVS